MEFSHDFLVRFVNYMNREHGEPDPHLRSFAEHRTCNPTLGTLEEEDSQRQLDRFIQVLESPEYPSVVENSDQILRQINDGDLYYSAEEDWWTNLRFYLNLSRLQEIVEDESIPIPSKLQRELFSDQIGPENYRRLAERAERTLEAMLKPDLSIHRNVICDEGDVFAFTYQGKGPYRFKKTVGFEFIVKLLLNKFNWFETPTELNALVSPAMPDTTHPDERVFAEFEGGDSSDESSQELTWGIEGRQRSEDQALKQNMRKIKEEYDSHQEELKEARNNNDPATISRLEPKMRLLLKELNKLKPLREGKAEWDDRNEKARQRISHALHRALKKIRKGKAPELAKHLENSLTPISYPFKYTPSPDIEWAKG